ncbi:DUF4105 domain-containing protein [Flagellatimonas centrodinii]|uniref:Lnb N-terminal periplasmic domain-containing protein n=1 Tax=Flagellatimonas centrodinii TaxID=2806210 RepID=UPI001FEE22E5|nr:DUF4105 domain-containing protein [Flagellatimonas centrodinii]ULQ45320.1 DUF4105 domain-containing protein [Flagellatimonas centrodinii]
MIRPLVLALLATLLWTGTTAAAPTVSLLTFQPGEIYWQRYGHNALLVRDPLRSTALVYNYGLFDFAQKNFLLNFARGRMQYRVAPEPLSYTLDAYRAEGRWVYEQQLALQPDQATALADFLAWNVQPVHADYRYDYFAANCSTKVRDALDSALGGGLRAALEGAPSGTSYRAEANRMMAPDPLMMLGTDLLMGPATDRPIDRWQQSFLPEVLMTAVRELQVDDGIGGTRPLVARGDLLVAGRLPSADSPSTDRRGPLTLLGLTLAAVLLLTAAWRPWLAAAIGGGLAVIAGAVGVILLLAWTVTDHWAMAANHNLLLFSPLALLMVPAWCRPRHPVRRRTLGIAVLIALGAVLALPLALWPGMAQHNLQWVGLWLPIHLAGLWVLSRRSEPR